MERKLKILLLEDSRSDAEIIQRLLIKEMRCEFNVVMNKKNFLLALEDLEADIIISDNSLPQFNATDALKITRQLYPLIPFILVTGTVSEEFAANIIKQGADDYILKDRLIRLPAAITAAVKQRRIGREKLLAEEKLIKSEENYRTIMERLSDAFVAIDKNWCYTYVNKTAGKILGRKPAELIGKHIWTEFPEGIDQAFYKAYYKAMEIQKYIHIEEYYKPFDLWLENHIYPSADGLSIFFRDITERKKAEQQKEFDSNNLKALINNTEDQMWSVDNDLKLITCNDSFNKVIELTTGKSLKKGANILSTQFTDDQRKRYNDFYMLALSGQSFTIIDHFEHPFEFWCEISFYPIHQRNRIVGTACFSRDITERKRNEENFKLLEKKILEQKIQEHRKIARAIIKAQERERNHLGQELHDNINQILAGTKLYLGVAGKKNEAVKELIKYPMELIDSSIEEMRLLCHKMVTPVKNISLEELFKDLIISLDQNTITKTYFTYSIPKADLSDDLKLNIFRIIQELVNNTWKYAEAKNVEISIQEQEEFIHIDVSDDGKGFDVEKKRGGIGISNIINRVESFNGEIEIESSPGKGCKTKIRIPY